MPLRGSLRRGIRGASELLGCGDFGILAERIGVVDSRRDRVLFDLLIDRGAEKGIEKVISTIGIREARGFARQFSSIGVRPELAESTAPRARSRRC